MYYSGPPKPTDPTTVIKYQDVPVVDPWTLFKQIQDGRPVVPPQYQKS